MSTIEQVYDAHIKSLAQDQQLELAALIRHRVSLETRAKRKRAKKNRSIMALHGLGAELWQGLDAQRYVDQLRNEWDQEPT